MKNRTMCFAAVLFAILGADAQASGSIAFVNGRVYAGDAVGQPAEAVLAVDGRIRHVGTTEEVRRLAPSGTRIVDLVGATVLPGLADSHAHLAGIGWREISFDVTGVPSIAALQERLRERAASDASPWITGSGWIESRWQPAVFPTRQQLDEAVTSKPVALERADGHALIVNSLALKIAGIDRNTPDPVGGQILRDPATGEPTGMVIDRAKALVERHIPPPASAEVARALAAGAERSVRLGWTQLHLAGTTWQEIEHICRLYAAGRIKLRLYAAIGGPSADADRLLAIGRDWKSCDPRLTVRAIKLYIDGALGSRGAALLAPYSDAPGSTGLLVNPPEEILRIAIAGLKSGIQVQTHAIGDRGNRLVLDQYERAFASVPPEKRAVANPRYRIEHAQVVDPTDMPRFAALDVIASMQTSHAISDMLFAPARLGPGRIASAYAWRSLLSAGARIAGGSDAPVEQGESVDRVLCRGRASHARRIRGSRMGSRSAPVAGRGARDPDLGGGLRRVRGKGPRHDRHRQARRFQHFLRGPDGFAGEGNTPGTRTDDGDRG